jgi:glucose-1-phosphate thymidylyltransferase
LTIVCYLRGFENGDFVKGILLAGGTGSRLRPATSVTSKHLLAVYDKPLIYYSLTSLMLAGIREILVICSPADESAYVKLLGTGNQFGLKISYASQESAQGIAEALLIGEDFVAGSPVCLALGDNIFHGSGLSVLFRKLGSLNSGASILLRRVPDPERFGVAEVNGEGRVINLSEKPISPKSNLAITGLYFFDESASSKARTLLPSSRGELEITDLNLEYLKIGALYSQELPRGTMWLDTGTADSLLDASLYVKSVQEHSGQLIGSPEEVAWRQGWINEDEAARLASLIGSKYGQFLQAAVSRGR